MANNENTLTITLTETHLNEKILDSEIQMKNYIGFSADRTLGRKNGGVITYIKATEALDAEQLIAKSNSYVEYQLIHLKKRNIVIINVYRPPDCPTEKILSLLSIFAWKFAKTIFCQRKVQENTKYPETEGL